MQCEKSQQHSFMFDKLSKRFVGLPGFVPAQDKVCQAYLSLQFVPSVPFSQMVWLGYNKIQGKHHIVRGCILLLGQKVLAKSLTATCYQMIGLNIVKCLRSK